MSRWREAIVPVLYAIIILFTVRHYGVTWDEGVFVRLGEQTLAHGPAAVYEMPDFRDYGPLFETLCAAVYRVLPFDKYDVRHFLIALTGLATVIAAGRFCKHAGADPIAGQLFLVVMPQFYGHAFNNSKDIPVACAATWMMVAFARLREPVRARDGVLPGIALGLAMSIRAGSIVLIAIPIAAILIARRWRMLVAVVASLPVAWIVMVALWPYAWASPILRPIAAIRFAAKIPTPYQVLFEGHPIVSTQLPARYLAEMFAITIPIVTLLFALAGIAVAIRKMDFAPLLAVCWLIVPLVMFVVLRPNIYDGVRHFLFVVPAFAVLAAIGLTLLPRYALVLAAIPIVAMIGLHPYEATYFNAFVGGTHGASSRFDTDYWVSSYREAALWLRDHRCAGRPTRVLVAATAFSRDCLTHYLSPQEFVVARMFETKQQGGVPQPFDYYVATTRYGLSANYERSPVAYLVERDGAPFTVIRGACR